MKHRMKGRNMKPAKLRRLLRMAQGQNAPVSGPRSSAAENGEPNQGSDVSVGFQPSSEEHTRFLADLATGLWRLRQRMIQANSVDQSEQMRWAYRHFEAVWDVLIQARVEVQDHTGAAFDPGMSLKVIAFQPTPGMESERVTETIRPSVYYKGEPIQIGEVIVGTPEARREMEEVESVTPDLLRGLRPRD